MSGFYTTAGLYSEDFVGAVRAAGINAFIKPKLRRLTGDRIYEQRLIMTLSNSAIFRTLSDGAWLNLPTFTERLQVALRGQNEED